MLMKGEPIWNRKWWTESAGDAGGAGPEFVIVAEMKTRKQRDEPGEYRKPYGVPNGSQKIIGQEQTTRQKVCT